MRRLCVEIDARSTIKSVPRERNVVVAVLFVRAIAENLDSKPIDVFIARLYHVARQISLVALVFSVACHKVVLLRLWSSSVTKRCHRT